MNCSLLKLATECKYEYNRYKELKEHFEGATSTHNNSVNSNIITGEELMKSEFQIIELRYKMNDAYEDYHRCRDGVLYQKDPLN